MKKAISCPDCGNSKCPKCRAQDAAKIDKLETELAALSQINQMVDKKPMGNIERLMWQYELNYFVFLRLN